MKDDERIWRCLTNPYEACGGSGSAFQMANVKPAKHNHCQIVASQWHGRTEVCVWTSNIKLRTAGGRVRDDNSNNSSRKCTKMHQVCSKFMFYLVNEIWQVDGKIEFLITCRCYLLSVFATCYGDLRQHEVACPMGGNSACKLQLLCTMLQCFCIAAVSRATPLHVAEEEDTRKKLWPNESTQSSG